MSRRSVWLPSALAAVAVSAVEPAAAASPAADGRCEGVAVEGPDVEAVRRLESFGAQVNVDGWPEAVARAFFAPDFVAVAPGGAVSDLGHVLSTFKDGASPGWARRFEITSLDIRIYNCSTAVVIGAGQVQPLGDAAGTPAWRIRFLNVWRLEKGRWLYAANQFTRLSETPDRRSPPVP